MIYVLSSKKAPAAYAVVNVTYPASYTVTATDGTTTLNNENTTKNGKWVCVVPNAGEWTFSMSNKGGGKTVSEVVTISKEQQAEKISLSFISRILNDNSWAEIASVDSEGANYWSIGDCKAVTVSGTVGTRPVYVTYYVYIIGFNHNGATGIDFGTFKTALSGGTDICLIDSKYNSNSTDGTKYFNMNHSAAANYGGWNGCDLRYDVLGSTNTNDGNATATTATSPVPRTLMAALPSELRAVMKPMTIYTDNTGGGKGETSSAASLVTATVDYLPLLAEFEIFGLRSSANIAEQNYQAQYAYYSAGNSKVKYGNNATGSAAIWWERSPFWGNINDFCDVATSGKQNSDYAKNVYGLAPIFRV